MSLERILKSIAVLAALLGLSALTIFPLWWMLVVSLETPANAGAAMVGGGDVIKLWPSSPQWANYAKAVEEMGSRRGGGFGEGFKDALANSTVITVLVCVGTILSSSLVGFAFARVRFRGRQGLFLLMLATMMLPGQVTMIPLFLLFRSLGWIDTMLPLVVPAFFGSAFFVFMYRQFIAQVPEALVEAARIDGLGWLGIWWRIMLPLCRPVTAIVAVFTFIWTWNDFLGPLIYLQREESMTLAVALNGFRNQYGNLERVHLLMAASLLTMLPCVLLFLGAQKQFVEGLGAGAVKG